MPRERIIVVETFDERDIPTREPLPSTDLVFAGTGPMRGEYEQAQAAGVEYLPPPVERAA